MEQNIRRAAEWIAASRRLVVLTGAGASQESGIPTFRDAENGIWGHNDPLAVASPWGYMIDPDTAWNWHEHLRDLARRAEPNPGHVALAELETLVPQVIVITQNIDGLHERAGSSDVIPLHGSLLRNKCFHNCLGDPTCLSWDDLDDYVPMNGVPHCPHCGGWVRPDVVWFGEALPSALIDRAFQITRQADVMLVVGTSGTVQPAARLPLVAERSGAKVIDVNPRLGGITEIAELWLAGLAGEMLPRLVAAVRARRNEGGPSSGA